MTPQSVGLVRAERRLVEEFYNCPLHVNAGLILAPFLSREQTETVESLRVLLTEAELDIADLQAVSTDELTALAREQNALANATSQTVLQFGADAVPALTTLTRDPQPTIRIWAANTLGRIGLDAAPAIPVLTELLADRNEQVRLAARAALSAIEP